MAIIQSILVLILFAVAGSHVARTGPELPIFSNTYIVDGTLSIPYAEIKEPFTAWFDKPNNRSRIDYYRGMVKTFQRADIGPYGIIWTVAPMTTEEVINEDTCFIQNGTENSTVTIQSVLPELDGFVNAGAALYRGVPCSKWKKIEVIGNKVNSYTLWVHQGQPSFPVHYEMKGYNTLLGSHYDKYEIDYVGYNSVSIDEQIFNAEANLTCRSFPGPGATHAYNPMRELVNNQDSHVHETFERFKNDHNKIYDNEREHELRRSIFRQNFRYVHSKNRAGLGYSLAINHLADFSGRELRRLRGRLSSQGYNGGLPFHKERYRLVNIPDSLDWRLYVNVLSTNIPSFLDTKYVIQFGHSYGLLINYHVKLHHPLAVIGAVTPVKDQSVCGSCWSFGTTGTIEGAYFLKTGQLVRLSQQALIDCSWGFQNNGCDGGEDFRAYKWIMKHDGIPTEDDYGSYLGADGFCHANNVTKVANIKAYVNVTAGDADALKMAIAKHGPISVAIDAAHKSLSFYSNGVYYEPACGNREENLDHAVLAVGYGTMNSQPYWLIKNSWSTYWGNDGYVLISQRNNNCGVTTTPTFVILK